MNKAHSKRDSEATEMSIKEKLKQYHIMVYIRIRPPLKNEFGKEISISSDGEVFCLCFF